MPTGRRRTAPVSLKASGALFADPDLNVGGMELLPGHWVDIRIKGAVECAFTGPICIDFAADGNGELVTRWYERVATHRVDGCDEDHGNFVKRELESVPLRVAVRA